MSRITIGLMSLALLITSTAFGDELVPTSGLDTSSVTISTVTAPAEEPFIFPVARLKPKVVSGFGHRSLKKVSVALAMTTLPPDELHEGVDIAVKPGEAIVAAKSGKVIFAGFSNAYVSRKSKKEKSRFVIIAHPDKTSTRYVHLNRIEVRPQQMIQAGDKLGTASDSDEWTVPVLHFEVRDAAGRPLNPLKFLPVDNRQ